MIKIIVYMLFLSDVNCKQLSNNNGNNNKRNFRSELVSVLRERLGAVSEEYQSPEILIVLGAHFLLSGSII